MFFLFSLISEKKKQSLRELFFFHKQSGNISVTVRAVCFGELQEEQIAQRAPFCVFQEHKCINICTTSERDGASYCLVVSRKQ